MADPFDSCLGRVSQGYRTVFGLLFGLVPIICWTVGLYYFVACWTSLWAPPWAGVWAFVAGQFGFLGFLLGLLLIISLGLCVLLGCLALLIGLVFILLLGRFFSY